MSGLPTQPRAWPDLRAALVLFFVLIASSIVTAVIVQVTGATTPWLDVGEATFDTLVVGVASAPLWPTLRPLLRWPRPAGRAWLLAGGTLLALAVVATLWIQLASLMAPVVRCLDSFEAHGWPLASAFAMVSLWPAVVEELAFRGVLLQRFRAAMDDRDACLLQAALFAVVHCSPVILPSHFAMGFALGWLRQRTGSLLPGMVVHATWNAAVLVEELVRGPG